MRYYVLRRDKRTDGIQTYTVDIEINFKVGITTLSIIFPVISLSPLSFRW